MPTLMDFSDQAVEPKKLDFSAQARPDLSAQAKPDFTAQSVQAATPAPAVAGDTAFPGRGAAPAAVPAPVGGAQATGQSPRTLEEDIAGVKAAIAQRELQFGDPFGGLASHQESQAPPFQETIPGGIVSGLAKGAQAVAASMSQQSTPEGALTVDFNMDPNRLQTQIEDIERRPEILEEMRGLTREVLPEPTSGPARVAEGITAGTVESAPLLMAAGPLGAPAAAGRIAGAAATAARAAPVVARAAEIGVRTGVGLAEFGAASAGPQASIQNDPSLIGKGAVHPIATTGSLAAKLATFRWDEITEEELIQGAFLVGIGAHAFFTRGRAGLPAEATKGGGSGSSFTVSPEGWRYIYNLPDDALASMVAKWETKGTPGLKAMADAARARMRGEPMPQEAQVAPAPTPVAPTQGAARAGEAIQPPARPATPVAPPQPGAVTPAAPAPAPARPAGAQGGVARPVFQPEVTAEGTIAALETQIMREFGGPALFSIQHEATNRGWTDEQYVEALRRGVERMKSGGVARPDFSAQAVASRQPASNETQQPLSRTGETQPTTPSTAPGAAVAPAPAVAGEAAVAPKREPVGQRYNASENARFLEDAVRNPEYDVIEAANMQVDARGSTWGLSIHPEDVLHLSNVERRNVADAVPINENSDSRELLGDRQYERVIEAARRGKKGRVNDMIEMVLSSPDRFDPDLVIRAYLQKQYGELSPEQRKAGFEIINPKELPPGTKVTIANEEFTVSRTDDGVTVLEDGVTLIAPDRVPIDRGSVEKPKAAPPSGALTGQQQGLLGDRFTGGVTGGKSGNLFETKPTTSKAIEEEAAFRAKQTPKDVETQEMFQQPAGDVDPGTVKDPARSAEAFHKDTAGAEPLEKFIKVFTGLGRAGLQTVNFFGGEHSVLVRNTATGQVLIRKLDKISSKALSLAGSVENKLVDGYKALKPADRAWLQKITVGGTGTYGNANIQRLTENTAGGKLAPPTDGVKTWGDGYQNMLDVTGDEAIRLGLQKLGKEGNVVPFAKKKGGAFLRVHTPDAMEAAWAGGGPFFESWTQAIADANPGLTKQEAAADLHEFLGPESVRKVGHIEQSRRIENMPTHIKHNGEWVQVLETDPLLMPIRAAEMMSRRIYFAAEFGQNLKGAVTKIERMRAQHAASGGDVRAFDVQLELYNRRPYGRLPGDPRAWWKRTGKILNSVVAGMQTSASVIPNIPQTLMTIGMAPSPLAYLRAVARTLLHPKQTAAQAAAVGAMHRASLEWVIRKGHAPEDVTRIIKDITTRVTGSYWLAQFNNMVAAEMGKALAGKWAKNGLKRGDEAIARRMRLTNIEIRDARRGIVKAATVKKIMQNFVKTTQFVTEDPHRKAPIQNIPVLTALIDYNNYAIGTGKYIGKNAFDLFDAAAKGDGRAVVGALNRLASLMLAMGVAGGLAILLKRVVSGDDPVRDDEAIKDLFVDGMFESALLGPTQRVMSADQYSSGDPDKFIIAISPKVAFVRDFFAAVTGTGRMAKYPFFTRIAAMLKKNTPAYRRLSKLAESIADPNLAAYREVRGMVHRFGRDTLKREGGVPTDQPINPEYEKVKDALRSGDTQEAFNLVREFVKTHKEDSGALDKLKSSLRSARPINLNEEATAQFLKSLPAEQRKAAAQMQAMWNEAIAAMK